MAFNNKIDGASSVGTGKTQEQNDSASAVLGSNSRRNTGNISEGQSQSKTTSLIQTIIDLAKSTMELFSRGSVSQENVQKSSGLMQQMSQHTISDLASLQHHQNTSQPTTPPPLQQQTVSQPTTPPPLDMQMTKHKVSDAEAQQDQLKISEYQAQHDQQKTAQPITPTTPPEPPSLTEIASAKKSIESALTFKFKGRQEISALADIIKHPEKLNLKGVSREAVIEAATQMKNEMLDTYVKNIPMKTKSHMDINNFVAKFKEGTANSIGKASGNSEMKKVDAALDNFAKVCKKPFVTDGEKMDALGKLQAAALNFMNNCPDSDKIEQVQGLFVKATLAIDNHSLPPEEQISHKFATGVKQSMPARIETEPQIQPQVQQVPPQVVVVQPQVVVVQPPILVQVQQPVLDDQPPPFQHESPPPFEDHGTMSQQQPQVQPLQYKVATSYSGNDLPPPFQHESPPPFEDHGTISQQQPQVQPLQYKAATSYSGNDLPPPFQHDDQHQVQQQQPQVSQHKPMKRDHEEFDPSKFNLPPQQPQVSQQPPPQVQQTPPQVQQPPQKKMKGNHDEFDPNKLEPPTSSKTHQEFDPNKLGLNQPSKTHVEFDPSKFDLPKQQTQSQFSSSRMQLAQPLPTNQDPHDIEDFQVQGQPQLPQQEPHHQSFNPDEHGI